MNKSHILDTRAKREYLVLALCAIVLLALLVPSLFYARREYRDGVERENIARLKRQLEDINNEKGYYPLTFSALPYEYHVTKADSIQALEWYVRGVLENPHESFSGFDAEEGHNFWYRYMNDGNTTYYEICGGAPACDITSIR